MLNENIPLFSVHRLREAGLDVVSISEEFPGITDQQVMTRAKNEGRIIVTFDSDYGELIYRQQLPVPLGIIYLRFIPDYPEEPAELLLELFKNDEIQLEKRFTVANRNQIRQRKL